MAYTRICVYNIFRYILNITLTTKYKTIALARPNERGLGLVGAVADIFFTFICSYCLLKKIYIHQAMALAIINLYSFCLYPFYLHQKFSVIVFYGHYPVYRLILYLFGYLHSALKPVQMRFSIIPKWPQ